jgi:hypothetical protein
MRCATLFGRGCPSAVGVRFDPGAVAAGGFEFVEQEVANTDKASTAMLNPVIKKSRQFDVHERFMIYSSEVREKSLDFDLQKYSIYSSKIRTPPYFFILYKSAMKSLNLT